MGEGAFLSFRTSEDHDNRQYDVAAAIAPFFIPTRGTDINISLIAVKTTTMS